MKKKSGGRLIRSLAAALLPVGLSAVLLSGCGKEAAHYEKVEKNAVRYYEKKYGVKTKVEKSYKAGNSGLFGFIGVKDRAYEMSDGTNIYWCDSEEYYADDRQAEEISAALREEIMEPSLKELGEDRVVSEYTFNRTGMESFDKVVFTQYYDGDIIAFAGKEEIHVRDFSVLISEDDFKGKAERFLNATMPFFQKTSGRITVVAKEYEGPRDLETFRMAEGNPIARAVGTVRFGEKISWIENVYVEVIPGVSVSSDISDLVLEPGDVTFAEAGTAQDLQKMLDDGYYSLPVEAEENKKGGYSVHDQAHERRTVLANKDAVIYQLQFSDRVRERLDSNGKASLYFMIDSSQEYPLWYYPNDPRFNYSVYQVAAPGKSRGEYEYIEEGVRLYFGELER